ncbi:MAG: gliding motility-associated protein GldE [Crocinitomicaceae bacterium]|nr:gliding motility-associated protein GldE [Crocinitomicaceae bacterium]
MTQTDPLPDPLASIALSAFNADDVLLIGIVLLLLIASALFAGAEVAFFSLSELEKEKIKKTEKRKARIAQKLLEKPKHLLATILIGKNFLNVAFVIVTFIALTKINTHFHVNWGLNVLINTFLIALFLVFVGESYPKTIAYRNKAPYVCFMSLPILILQYLPPFSFLIKPLSKGTKTLEKRAKRKGIEISPTALETVLSLSQDPEENKNELNILQGVLKFGNTDVKQIMCPRMDVVGIDEGSTLEEVMKVVVEAGYSRLPVYKENFDEVVGVIFVKDLLHSSVKKKDFDWKKLIRKPLYVPENKKIDDLLREFQLKKIHIAIVIDEYGGPTGIVTLEDVLEEIVGDITDEYDGDDDSYAQINDNTFIFEGQTSLTDFYKALEIDGNDFEEKKEDAESIGGFIIEMHGRIPKNNETFTVGNIKLIVESSDKKRVRKVRVIIENN